MILCMLFRLFSYLPSLVCLSIVHSCYCLCFLSGYKVYSPMMMGDESCNSVFGKEKKYSSQFPNDERARRFFTLMLYLGVCPKGCDRSTVCFSSCCFFFFDDKPSLEQETYKVQLFVPSHLQ